MFLAFPATSILHPTSRLAPQSYGCQDQGYYQLHPNVPRTAVPPYSASQQRFFHQPPADQFEEREYQRALEVISNYHRRQAEKEATARQRNITLAIELEQRRQRAELVASHRAEIIRTRRARARLAAAERQIAVNEFLNWLKGGQLVINQPQVANRKPLSYVLKQHYANESDPSVAEQISNILSPLGSRAVHSEEPEKLNSDSTKLVEEFLSPLFPGLVFRAKSEAGDDKTDPALHPGGHGESTQKSGTVVSSGSPDPSPNKESTSLANLDATDMEHVPDRATSLSCIEHIRNNLTKLQTDFVLPTELDHYAPSADDHDDAASVSSVSSSDLTKLIPYTSTNKPIYKYEHELSGLLEELDRVESHGDVEVRDKRKEAVKAVERALEGVEHAVGEAVKERLSLVSPTPAVAEKSLKGFDVDEDVTEEPVLTSVEEQVDAPVVIDDVAALKESAPTHPGAVVTDSVRESSLAEGIIPELNTPVVPDDTSTTLDGESSLNHSDVGPSTSTPVPESVELSLDGIELMEPQLPSEEVEASDTFLLAEELLPRSPVKQARLIESDIEDGVLVLDDDEKSDWSEIEN